MSKAKSGPGDHDSDLQGASEQGFNIVPAKGIIAGETLHQLTEDWWHWVLDTPMGPLDPVTGNPTTHPMYDVTGDYAGTNNDGSVFFLAGNFGDAEYQRDITVEAGTPIMLPILNNIALQFVGAGEKGAANAMLAEWQKSVSDLFLEVDGVAVKNLQADLVRTSWFGGAVVEDSLAEDWFGMSGDIAEAKSVGYWSVIDGLSEGDHTLVFGGTAGSFSTQTTVHLTVV